MFDLDVETPYFEKYFLKISLQNQPLYLHRLNINYGVGFREMNTTQVWILAIIGLGLFIYFVPYKNIKIVHKKLDTIIELLNKKDN